MFTRQGTPGDTVWQGLLIALTRRGGFCNKFSTLNKLVEIYEPPLTSGETSQISFSQSEIMTTTLPTVCARYSQ